MDYAKKALKATGELFQGWGQRFLGAPPTAEEAPEPKPRKSFRYDVYLSYDHQEISELKVSLLKEHLEGQDLKVFAEEGFYDETWMEAMCQSGVVLCAVSQTYLDAAGMWTNPPDAETKSKKEFAYANKVATKAYMIPVSLAESLEWTAASGPVGRVLGSAYVEDSFFLDDDAEEKVYDEIGKKVKDLNQKRRQEVAEEGIDPSIIEALKGLLEEEQKAIETERDRYEEGAGRRLWLEMQLEDLARYGKDLQSVFELDKQIQEGRAKQEKVRREAERLAIEADNKLEKQMKILDDEREQQEKDFQKRLDLRKAKKKKKKEEGAKEVEGGESEDKERDTAGEVEADGEETMEIEEKEKFLEEQKQRKAEIMEEFKKGQEELRVLQEEKDKLEDEVEKKRLELEEAQRQAAIVMPKYHNRLEELKAKKAQAIQEKAAEKEKQIDAAQRRKAQQEKKQEMEFMRKMAEQEERKRQLFVLEEKKKAEQQDRQRQERQRTREKVEKKRLDDQRKRDEERLKIEEDREKFLQQRAQAVRDQQKRFAKLTATKPRERPAERPMTGSRENRSRPTTPSTDGSPGKKAPFSRSFTARSHSPEANRGRNLQNRPSSTEDATRSRSSSVEARRPGTAGARGGIQQADNKGPPILDWSKKTITTLKTTIRTTKNEIKGSEELVLHFTNDFGAEWIHKTGLRASAEGQGGGGFYVVKVSTFMEILHSESRKFDQECFMRCKVALFGVVNAKDEKRSGSESIPLALLIKIPNFLIEEVPMDEEDERIDLTPLHYVPYYRLLEMGEGTYKVDKNHNLLLQWRDKILKWFRLFTVENLKEGRRLSEEQAAEEIAVAKQRREAPQPNAAGGKKKPGVAGRGYNHNPAQAAAGMASTAEQPEVWRAEDDDPVEEDVQSPAQRLAEELEREREREREKMREELEKMRVERDEWQNKLRRVEDESRKNENFEELLRQTKELLKIQEEHTKQEAERQKMKDAEAAQLREEVERLRHQLASRENEPKPPISEGNSHTPKQESKFCCVQ